MFDYRINSRIQELLENFDVIATFRHIALVPGSSNLDDLNENVNAALIATTMGLKSIDHAKRRYVESKEERPEKFHSLGAYNEAYKHAKNYINVIMRKASTQGHPPATVGVYGAAIVLQRLQSSFFCSHLLYNLGHKYEGHAVSRLILEQIAWAYTAYPLTDLEHVKKIETTKSIGNLKSLVPDVGRLYGYLSTKTHIAYDSHNEFLTESNNKGALFMSRGLYYEYAQVILHLADLFAVVWEMSQFPYINGPEAVKMGDCGLEIDSSRPFSKLKPELLANVEKLQKAERDEE